MRAGLCSVLTLGLLLISRQATAVVLQSVSLSQSSVTGGTAVAGTVTLDSSAPGGGVRVTLSSSHPAATVDLAQVTVPAGGRTASFTVNTVPVAVNVPRAGQTGGSALTGVSVLITASPAPGHGPPKTASLVVLTPMVSNFGVWGPVVGSADTVGAVTLTGLAPPGGITLSIASSNQDVAMVPASVTIPAGASSGTFKIPTRSVSAPTQVLISASRSTLNFKDATLLVTPPSLAVVGCEPLQVTSGTPVTCTVWLNGLAPTKVTVTLASSNPTMAAVPASASVSLDAGHSHAPFTLTTQVSDPAYPVYTADVVISASYAGATKGATVKVVRPLPKLASVSCGFSGVDYNGFFVESTVTLTGPAPDPGGARTDYTISGAQTYPWTSHDTVPPGKVQYRWPVHFTWSGSFGSPKTVTVQAAYNGVNKSASCTYP